MSNKVKEHRVYVSTLAEYIERLKFWINEGWKLVESSPLPQYQMVEGKLEKYYYFKVEQK